MKTQQQKKINMYQMSAYGTTPVLFTLCSQVFPMTEACKDKSQKQKPQKHAECYSPVTPIFP